MGGRPGRRGGGGERGRGGRRFGKTKSKKILRWRRRRRRRVKELPSCDPRPGMKEAILYSLRKTRATMPAKFARRFFYS